MSSFVDIISRAIKTVNRVIDQRETGNRALVEKVKVIDDIAKLIFALSGIIAIYAIVSMPIHIFPILFGCAVITYAAHEVSIVADNVKKFFTESFGVWWEPEKSFAENLLLNELSRDAKMPIIMNVTKNAPVASALLCFWYS